MTQVICLRSVNDYLEWRAAARCLLRAGRHPRAVEWFSPSGNRGLFAETNDQAGAGGPDGPAGRVPTRFVRLAEVAICHRDPGRFALLYSLLWRLQKDRRILFDLDDPDVSRVNRRAEAVVAAYRRMKDELRFRRAVAADGHKGLVARYEPDHYVLERVAPHFVQRFAHEDWLIRTPYRSAHWDGRMLSFGRGDDGGAAQ